jgi:hypothetical protein
LIFHWRREASPSASFASALDDVDVDGVGMGMGAGPVDAMVWFPNLMEVLIVKTLECGFCGMGQGEMGGGGKRRCG